MRVERFTDAARGLWDERVRDGRTGTFLFLRDYMEYHRDRFEDHSLIFREEGPQLALLKSGDKVELRSIKLGRNLGTEFEVLAGLSASDTVINSPPDSLSQGEQVRVAKDAAPQPAHEAEVR